MKSKKKILVLTGVVFAMLAVLAFGTLDYDISKGIINKSSHFAEFFNRFGEMPVSLAMLISVMILFGSRKKEKHLNNILGMLFGIPFIALFSFMTVFMPIRYTYEHAASGIPGSMMLLSYGLTAVLFLIAMVWIRKTDVEVLRSYRRVALALIVIAFGAVLVVNLVKILWARPRMRSIDSIEQFKYWFQINGPSNNNELKSFPSGHTANSFVMLAFVLFIPMTKEKLRSRFTTFAILWGSMVALSRVILGAHFLSDVIVGGFITILLIYICELLFMTRKGKRKRVGNI